MKNYIVHFVVEIWEACVGLKQQVHLLSYQIIRKCTLINGMEMSSIIRVWGKMVIRQ